MLTTFLVIVATLYGSDHRTVAKVIEAPSLAECQAAILDVKAELLKDSAVRAADAKCIQVTLGDAS